MKKVNLFYQCHFIVVSDISRNNIYLKNKIKLYLKTENLTTGWHDGWHGETLIRLKTQKNPKNRSFCGWYKPLILLNKLVAGVGFEPTTFRL